MRIVHTCLRYPPATGGVETYVKEIVERTRNVDEGRDVRVLTSKMKTHGPIKNLLPKALINDAPYIQRLQTSRTPLVSYPRLQALRYYLGHHRPDIIESYSFWYQPADVSARYAKANNIPFIFHSMYYENDTRRKIHWQLYKKTIGAKTFSAADVVVVISPHEQKLIEDARFPVRRFELIPPGVRIPQNTMHENPFRMRGLTGTILLSVGRIAHGKGLQDVIQCLPEILKIVPNTQYAIIGENFGAKHDLLEQAKMVGVDQHVHFLGKLDDSELAGAYKHADVFVHPSYYEAFGIVVADALASSLPVVARNVAAIPYVAPHEEAGLLFNNIQELKENLIALIQNPTLRQKLGDQGRARVLQEFSWEKSIKKLALLYQELISKKSQSSTSTE